MFDCFKFKPITALAASFGSVPAKPEFKKCDRIFFERSKSSGVAVTQPAGWGGESSEFKNYPVAKGLFKLNA